MNILRLALEELADGKAKAEIEHTFYARLEDLTELQKAASWENQEQWGYKIPRTDKNVAEGQVRVRKTTQPGGEIAYVHTIKLIGENRAKRKEVPLPVTEDAFNAYRMLADQGMIKDRYNFPIEGTEMKWEVDMFLVPEQVEGKRLYHPWCKVDLEVSDLSAKIPALPIAFTEVIMTPNDRQSPQEKAKITELYEQYFLSKNPYLKQK